MKTIVIKQATDLQSLAQQLAGRGGRAEPLAASLKRLNPHVDLQRIPAGTVLLVGNEPAIEGGLPQADALAGELKDSIAAAVAASREGLARRAQERKDVTDALKSTAIKRLIDSDADLAKRAAAVTDELKQEQSDDKAADKLLAELEAGALAEIGAVLKGLG